MTKPKGRKALQRELDATVDEIVEGLSFDPEDWFEFWHAHLDWDGEGNSSPEARQPYLKALIILLQRLQQRLLSFPKPCQTWLYILEEDSGQDAVYLHSPNANRDNFPFEFDGVDFAAAAPDWVMALLPDNQYRLGRAVYEGSVIYYVVPK